MEYPGDKIRDTAAESFVVPGIEDKRKLLGFFAAKHHFNLVLRVADLKELPLPAKHMLTTILSTFGELDRGLTEKEPDEFFIRQSFDGYVIVPFEKVLQAGMGVIRELQGILYLYKEVRMGKGEPSRVDPCECKGRGSKTPHPSGGCKKCEGRGVITTYLEMAPEERQLAEAKR